MIAFRVSVGRTNIAAMIRHLYTRCRESFRRYMEIETQIKKRAKPDAFTDTAEAPMMTNTSGNDATCAGCSLCHNRSSQQNTRGRRHARKSGEVDITGLRIGSITMTQATQ